MSFRVITTLRVTSSATAEIARVGGHYAIQGHLINVTDVNADTVRMRLPISEY